MHWDSEILINYPHQERPPVLRGQISNALKWVAYLERDIFLLFYYLSAFEIWPFKMDGLCWGGWLISISINNNILREQSNILREQNNILREQDNNVVGTK
jgi:hypothetical protein